jgi:hypothetical protein
MLLRLPSNWPLPSPRYGYLRNTADLAIQDNAQDSEPDIPLGYPDSDFAGGPRQPKANIWRSPCWEYFSLLEARRRTGSNGRGRADGVEWTWYAVGEVSKQVCEQGGLDWE